MWHTARHGERSDVCPTPASWAAQPFCGVTGVPCRDSRDRRGNARPDRSSRRPPSAVAPLPPLVSCTGALQLGRLRLRLAIRRVSGAGRSRGTRPPVKPAREPLFDASTDDALCRNSQSTRTRPLKRSTRPLGNRKEESRAFEGYLRRREAARPSVRRLRCADPAQAPCWGTLRTEIAPPPLP